MDCGCYSEYVNLLRQAQHYKEKMSSVPIQHSADSTKSYPTDLKNMERGGGRYGALVEVRFLLKIAYLV